MRLFLTPLYRACGALAACFMVSLAVLIFIQAAGRWLGLSVPGTADYAGYCMAASSFLALAYTLGAGEHIRVTLFLQRLAPGKRRIGELWCLLVGSFLSGYFAFYSIKMVRVSYQINDISQGPDATPLWIPQLGMAAGTTVLAIAFVDHFIAALRNGRNEEGGPESAGHGGGLG
jgi:TRAP-type C4-dicarboxylate transport system permease small subunit